MNARFGSAGGTEPRVRASFHGDQSMPAPSDNLEEEGVLAGTVFAFVAQISTAAFSAAITLYLVRALGPEGYGSLTLVLSVAVIAVLVADAALAQSTGRYLAPRAQDHQWISAALSAGLRLKLLSAVLACLGLFGLAGPIARAYHESQLEWPLRLVLFAVLGESLMLLWTTSLQAVRRNAVSVRLIFLESAVEATATIGLVAVGGGVAGAVLGRGVGYTFGTVVGGLLVVRHLRTSLHVRSVDRDLERRITRYAGPLLINTGAYTLYSQLAVQLVAAFLGHAAVGVFSAPFKIITLLSYPGQSVANAVSPRMAGPAPDVGAFTTALRWLLIYQVALMPPVVIGAGTLTRVLLGPGFGKSAVVLETLAPWLLLRGVSVLASTTVNYLGYARRRVPIVLISLGVMAALGVTLIPRIGLVGATVAMGLSYAVYVPLHLRICHESFQLPLAQLGLTLLRCTVAAAVMALSIASVSGGKHGFGHWLLTTGLGSAAYVGVLLATREIGSSELRQIRRVARRVGALTHLGMRRAQPRRPVLTATRETAPAVQEPLPSSDRPFDAFPR